MEVVSNFVLQTSIKRRVHFRPMTKPGFELLASHRTICDKMNPRFKQGEQERMDTYYDPKDLAKFEEIGKNSPELARKFFEYYGAVFAEGALTQREKALIALAVAHAVQCPYCIDAYTTACLENGSNLDEMTEAIHVTNAIRGGASLVHGVQMRKIAEKLSM
jgi:4-carboxymuconolactone decarboxylase